jgi:protein tyrosine phosphatase (PTP) superfamily phosphohydrolase (DUF442 family)
MEPEVAAMYFLKQVKLEKDALLLGQPQEQDLTALSRQGYKHLVDIMPTALRDRRLPRLARKAGLKYVQIPVEECDLESCRIDDDRVVTFSKFVNQCCHGPFIINTDDEKLGISLVMLANGFLRGEKAQEIIKKIESLGFALKGRKDIKRFIRDFYRHYKAPAILV